jgi:hypothetical protein
VAEIVREDDGEANRLIFGAVQVVVAVETLKKREETGNRPV